MSSIQLNLLHKPNDLSIFIVNREKKKKNTRFSRGPLGSLIGSFKTTFCSGFNSGKANDLEPQITSKVCTQLNRLTKYCRAMLGHLTKWQRKIGEAGRENIAMHTAF